MSETMKAQFDFTDEEKAAMLTVLAKYPSAPPHHGEVAEALKLEGSTVLFPDEALYLAGIVRPYYSFLAGRLESHPAVRSKLEEEMPGYAEAQYQAHIDL